MAVKTKLVNLRVTEAEHESWRRASGGNVSGWLRDLANAAIATPGFDTYLDRHYKPENDPTVTGRETTDAAGRGDGRHSAGSDETATGPSSQRTPAPSRSATVDQRGLVTRPKVVTSDQSVMVTSYHSGMPTVAVYVSAADWRKLQDLGHEDPAVAIRELVKKALEIGLDPQAIVSASVDVAVARHEPSVESARAKIASDPHFRPDFKGGK